MDPRTRPTASISASVTRKSFDVVTRRGFKKLRTGLRGDPVDRAREEWRQTARPMHTTHGPRTRRELFALWRSRGGLPG